MNIAGPQRQMFPDPVINLKTQAQSARIPKWIPDNVQKLARPVEDCLAVAVVSGNDACREVGLGVESQPAVAKRVVFTIWVFRLEVSRRQRTASVKETDAGTNDRDDRL
jgi:hypothetical protein